MDNTETQEMYLVTIDKLRKRNGMVRSIDVATERGFSKSTVHAGIKNLESMGLINFNAGSITLTKEGQAIADNIQKKHQLLLNMLTMMGMDEDNAEANACKMEHAITDEVYELFAKHYAFANRLMSFIKMEKSED